MSLASRWAVVVGLNDYAIPGASLKGAARDAVRICQWLLDSAGGGVPQSQLILALHPVACILGDPLDSLVNALRPVPCPNKDAIVDLLIRIVQKSGGEGERLYVYFSGHGLQYEATPDRFESAIVAPDCDSLHPDRSLTVTSILEYFEATGFLDQFFFFDACRNVPWSGRFEAGRVSLGPPCNPPSVAPQQFVCLATSKGKAAVELNASGEEGGAFTDALLRGLEGQGTAKAFDQERDCFVVRWNRMFEYVCGEVQVVQRTLANGEKLVQVPRDEGSKRGANRTADPELWSVAAASATFPTATLSVRIVPPEAVAGCHITATDLYDGDAPPTEHHPPTTSPTLMPLAPRWYRVFPKSTGFYYAKRSGLPVELMASREISLHLEPGFSLHEPPPAPSAAPRGPTRGAPSRPQPTQPASLIIDPDDSLTPWELLDASGREVGRGVGYQTRSVKPGIYTLRCVTPESSPVETLIDLQAGGERLPVSIAAAPPSAAVRNLAQRAGFFLEEGAHHRIRLSEELGMVGNVELSTTLALAATVATFTRDPGFGHKLRNINLSSLPTEFPSGTKASIMVVFGAEELAPSSVALTPAQELAAVRVAWWPSGSSPSFEGRPIDIRGAAPAIGQWFTFSQPGHGWLAIFAPGRAPILLNLFLPDRYVLTVIVHRFANGQIGIYLHSPRLGDASPHALQQARFLDLVQRYMLRGRYDYPAEPGDLLKNRPDDPVGALVAAYLSQRRGDQDRTLGLVTNLLERYPGWSDLHLIRGEALAQRDGSAAQQAYRQALNAGVPIFAGGLARLWQAVLRLNLEHPRRAALEQTVAARMPGVLWTAVTAQGNR